MKSTPIEQLLIRQIEEHFELKAGGLSQDSHVTAALRKVISTSVLFPDEEEALKKTPSPDRVSDLLLSLRLDRALARGTAAAGEVLKTPSIEPCPQVVVLGTKTPGNGNKGTDKNWGETLLHTLEAASDAKRATLTSDDTILPSGNTRRGTLLLASQETLTGLDATPEADLPEALRPDNGKITLLQLPKDLKNLQSQLESFAAKRIKQMSSGLNVGDMLGDKYQIDQEIGRGGFGAVYKATDTTLGTQVAIKVLNAKAADPAQREAFKEEARRVTRLKHPNIVDWKVFEERPDGSYYFVMEFLEGEELASLLEREKTLEPKRAARILLQVLSALRHAHHNSENESILHLDLKPQNVFMVSGTAEGEEETAKVIDFGIGLIAGSGGDDTSLANGGEDRSETLIPGEMPGETQDPGIKKCVSCTPMYASPEQAVHFHEHLARNGIHLSNAEIQNLDGRSDLYSFGVMAFQLLTGEYPFKKKVKSAWDWLRLHVEEPPTKVQSLRIKGVSRNLAGFVDRCLQKNRDERWTTTIEAHAALTRIVHPPVARTVAKVTVPLALIAIIAIVLVVIFKKEGLPDFDVVAKARATRDEVPKSLDGAALFLGENRRYASITLKAQEEMKDGSYPVLVPGKEEDALPLPGFRFEEKGDNFQLFVEEAPPERMKKQVRIRIDTKDGRKQFSSPFDLVYLAKDSWSISEVRLGRDVVINPGETVKIDPFGLPLQVDLTGCEKSDIEKTVFNIEIQGGKKPLGANDVSGKTAYRIDSLSDREEFPSSGKVSMTATVLDYSGNEKTFPFELEIVEPLKFSRQATLENATPDGKLTYTVYVDSKVELKVELNRKGLVDWTLMGSTEEGKNPASEHTIKLPDFSTFDSQKGFSGQLQIKVRETDGVVRSKLSIANSELEQSIKVTYSLLRPDFDRGLVSTDPGSLNKRIVFKELPHYSSSPNWDACVTVSRPVLLEINCRYREENGDWTSFEPQVVREGAARFPLRLEHPGAYEIEMTVYRFDEVSETRLPTPEGLVDGVNPTHFLIVDTTPPSLSIDLGDQLPEDRVLRDRTASPGFKIRVTDTNTWTQPTPVDLRYEVRSNHGDSFSGSMKLPNAKPIVPGATTSWVLDTWKTDTDRKDGIYTITFLGNDLAGNKIEPVQQDWELALTGPEVALNNPRVGATWAPSPTGNTPWNILLESTDGNGTESVRFRITSSGLNPLQGNLTRTGSKNEKGLNSRWEGPVPFKPEWSEKQVELEIIAVDLHGIQKKRIERFDLELVEDKHEPSISFSLQDRDHPVSRMRLVLGNHKAAYHLGGQSKGEEDARFAKFKGLPDWMEQVPGIIWALPYQANEIQDYYLDQHEVTCAEFIGFLNHEKGYSNPDNWPTGFGDPFASGPSPELRAWLREQDGNQPATGMSWAEAFAYATWVGKRLPSLVEWEYAVRGGPQYRPYSGLRDEQGTTISLNALNIKHTAPWPEGKGADVTHDTRIWNLGTNVAEWTASPARNGATKSWAEKNKVDLLAPYKSRSLADWSGILKVWIVGAGTKDQILFGYSARAACSPQEKQPNKPGKKSFLGFRCALDASKVKECLASGKLLGNRLKITTP